MDPNVPAEPRAPKGFVVLADGTAIREDSIQAVQSVGEGITMVFLPDGTAVTVNVDVQDVLDEMSDKPQTPQGPKPKEREL